MARLESQSDRSLDRHWDPVLASTIRTTLNEIEESFFSIYERLSKTAEPLPGDPLTPPRVERYYEDTPDIRFLWEGRDSVQRNVQAWLRQGDNGDLMASILAHAWKDHENPIDSGVTRSARQELFATIPVPPNRWLLATLLEYSYDEACSWTEKDLVKQRVLSNPENLNS